MIPGGISVLWLLAHGVSASDSLLVVLVVLYQVLLGSIIWQSIQLSRHIGPIESLGMGLAVGSLISVVSDQALLTTPIHKFSQVPLLIIALFLKLITRHKKFQADNVNLRHTELGWNFILLAAILGSGTLINGTLFASILILGWIVFSLVFYSGHDKYLYRLCSFLIAFLGLLMIWYFRPSISGGTWFLHPLYSGTDDNIFSESISKSVANFGFTDMAPAVGTGLKYHWFSLAWSGMVGRIAGTEPFTMTLHVVPLASFVGIASIVWALVTRITRSALCAGFAIILIFATQTLPEPMRAFHTITTSNTLSFIWFLAAITGFYGLISGTIKYQTVVIAIFCSATLLSKAPYGAALVFGLIGSGLAIWKSGTNANRYFKAYAMAILTMITTYFIFLQPHEWEGRSFSVVFNPLRIGSGSSFYPLLALITLSTIYFSRFAGITLGFRYIKNSAEQNFLYFLLGVSSTALLSSFVDGNSAERYFYGSAIVSGSILSAIGLNAALSQLITIDLGVKREIRVATGVVIGSAFLLSLLWGNRFGGSDSNKNGSNWGFLIPAISVCISFITLFLTSKFFSHQLVRQKVFIFLSIGLLFGSVGVFFYSATQSKNNNLTMEIAPQNDLESLTWLQENSANDDIIATNRMLCNPQVDCQFDDSSYLISAVTGRRVFVEGPRFVIGGQPYPRWIRDRIDISLNFAENPTTEQLNNLKSLGIDWFYLDSANTKQPLLVVNNLQKVTTIQYSNENILIVKID